MAGTKPAARGPTVRQKPGGRTRMPGDSAANLVTAHSRCYAVCRGGVVHGAKRKAETSRWLPPHRHLDRSFRLAERHRHAA